MTAPLLAASRPDPSQTHEGATGAGPDRTREAQSRTGHLPDPQSRPTFVPGQGQAYAYETAQTYALTHPDPLGLLHRATTHVIADDMPDDEAPAESQQAVEYATEFSSEAHRSRILTGLAQRTDLPADALAQIASHVAHDEHTLVAALLANPRFTDASARTEAVARLDADATWALVYTLPPASPLIEPWLPVLARNVYGTHTYRDHMGDFWQRMDPQALSIALHELIAALYPEHRPHVQHLRAQSPQVPAMHTPTRPRLARDLGAAWGLSFFLLPFSAEHLDALVGYVCEEVDPSDDADAARPVYAHLSDALRALLGRSDLTEEHGTRIGQAILSILARVRDMEVLDEQVTWAMQNIVSHLENASVPMSLWRVLVSDPQMAATLAVWRRAPAHPELLALLVEHVDDVTVLPVLLNRAPRFLRLDGIERALDLIDRDIDALGEFVEEEQDAVWRHFFSALSITPLGVGGQDVPRIEAAWTRVYERVRAWKGSDESAARFILDQRGVSTHYADPSTEGSDDRFWVWASRSGNEYLRAAAAGRAWSEAQVRLALCDPSPLVRRAVLDGEGVEAAVVEPLLVNDPDTGIRVEVARRTQDAQVLAWLASDPEEQVRVAVGERMAEALTHKA